MNDLICFAPANWQGGFYELAIEFEKPVDLSSLAKVLEIIRYSSASEGSWFDKNFQDSLDSSLIVASGITNDFFIYNLLNLPGYAPMGALTLFCPTNDTCWLIFAIPRGMLETIERNSASFKSLCADLNRFFCELAGKIEQVFPFNLALFGYEVAGNISLDDLDLTNACGANVIMSLPLLEKLPEMPELAQKLGPHLAWFPVLA